MEADPLNEDLCEGSLFYKFRPDNAEELIRCVEDAFADAVYPGDGDRDIIVSGCPSCCAECGETHELFRGKHWREVAESGQPLQNFGWGGLALLTPQAWRFYLPAYLIVSLSKGDGAEDALESALNALTPWPPAGLAELSDVIDYVKLSADWFAARAFSFSVAQMECLAAYVCAASKSVPEEDENWEALATYWTGRAAEARAEQGAATLVGASRRCVADNALD